MRRILPLAAGLALAVMVVTGQNPREASAQARKAHLTDHFTKASGVADSIDVAGMYFAAAGSLTADSGVRELAERIWVWNPGSTTREILIYGAFGLAGPDSIGGGNSTDSVAVNFTLYQIPGSMVHPWELPLGGQPAVGFRSLTAPGGDTLHIYWSRE